MTLRASGGQLRRFVSVQAEPANSLVLGIDHPAVVEGRSLFPSRLAPASAAKRFLISGHNNAKIGKAVAKGPWTGMPIFTLTLEERATCPQSCAQWRTCYGSGMPFPQRWDHRDPDFEEFLRAEIITKCREHPDGLVVRLHVLGDFYSFAYVTLWAELIDRFPQLHVYGYTARREDADDEESRKIAAGLRRLADVAFDQFALRFSRAEPGRMHAIVVDEDPQLDDVIMCPAQSEKTTACATCGLCWAEGARDKTIAFLRHGLKRRSDGADRRERSLRGRHVKPDALGLMPSQRAVHEAMLRLALPNGLVISTAAAICAEARVSIGGWGKFVPRLVDARLVQVLRTGGGARPAVYRVFAEPQAEFPPAPLIPLPTRKAAAVTKRDPIVRRDATPVAPRGIDEPLTRRKFYKPTIRLGAHGQVLNPWIVGSAGNYDIGTADERVAALAAEERARIEATYGAAFKPKAAADAE